MLSREIVASGQVKVERLDEPAGEEAGAIAASPTRSIDVGGATRAKLRRLLETIDELRPQTWREGPFTLLERFIERTGQILDLIGADTRESQRIAVNLASFLRFASDWQTAFPSGQLNRLRGLSRRLPGGRRRAARPASS